MEATAQHFDTLAASERLQEAGLTPQAAKVISQVVESSRGNGLVTAELKILRSEFKEEIGKMKAEIGKVNAEIDKINTQLNTIKWVLSIQTTVLVALVGAVVVLALRPLA